MPFASFKNVQKRFTKLHKERSQPQRRRHLGILPKQQDFRLKARDKELKSVKIRELRNKALDRNVDEFYFSMCNSRFDVEKGHIPLDIEKCYSDIYIKSSFSKNVTYLQYELQKELSKIHQLESKTNLLQSKLRNSRSRKTPKHIIFAETCGEMTELHCMYTEKTQVNETISSDLCDDDIYIQQCNAYKELSERLERAKQLRYILRQHEAKKVLMANLNKRGYKTVFKASIAAPPVYEFEHIRDR
ncbi:hypothetical protein MN116_008158 [Schistosoma mekongi]|uniref:U3 small nucleolar RNA-associated protein 11 n=1 Tax=Schistosoma mekongi TaxID=38744 RepID=A0AAE1Z6A1_SCHME|nr:hypothetical protein MN116_008158 [Schistosoma mekongi]